MLTKFGYQTRSPSPSSTDYTSAVSPRATPGNDGVLNLWKRAGLGRAGPTGHQRPTPALLASYKPAASWNV